MRTSSSRHSSNWSMLSGTILSAKNIGSVDWAPMISTKNDRLYNRDIGTVELDAHKFKGHFMGNMVNLGAFCLIALINIYLAFKNNLQETNLLHMNSTSYSGLTTPICPGSSSLPTACSRSEVLFCASS